MRRDPRLKLVAGRWSLVARASWLLATGSWLLVVLSSQALAQEPMRAGPFVFAGSTTVGVRFVDVNGRRRKYDEYFNLRQGPRLLEFGVRGSREEAGPLLDDFSLDAYGLGGDPFPQVRLRAEKKGIFQFALDYRKAQYIYDPVDDPLTDNHDFGTRRTFLTLNLMIIDPERFPKTSFSYRRVRRRGTALTTRHPFLIDVNDPVAGFFGQQFNPFLAEQPLDELTHKVTVASDFTIQRLTFHVEQSFTLFDHNVNYALCSSPASGLDAQRPLGQWEAFTWRQVERTHTPDTTVRLQSLITNRLEMRGTFVYLRSLGTFTATSQEAGRLGFISFYPFGLPPGTPYALAVNGDGQVKNNTRIAELGFSYSLRDNLTVHSDYRFHTYDQAQTTTNRAMRDLSNQTESTRSLSEMIYNVDVQAVDAVFEYAPIKRFTLRGGIRREDRDVDFASFRDGRFERDLSSFAVGRTRRTSWIASFSTRPIETLTLRGEFQAANVAGPYTRIAPRHETGTKARLRWTPAESLTLDGTFINKRSRSADTGFDTNFASGSLSVFYQPVEKLLVDVSYTYDDFDLRADINFITGIRPFRGVISSDRITDRLTQVGVGYDVRKDFSLRLAGQYLRSTGAGRLTGEQPRSGPVTWPLGRVEVSYRIRRLGQLTFAYDRTYFVDRVVGANSYSGHLFTLMLTRSF